MAAYALKSGLPSDSSNREITTEGASATVPFATPWTRFVACDICAQVSGSASAVVAVVQRSDVNPGADGALAQAAPADATGFTGNPTTGIAPNIYTEPGVGWWRINVTTVTAGTVRASLSGIG